MLLEISAIFCGLLLGLMIIKSVKILDIDHGIEVYQFAQHWYTYIPRGFMDELEQQELERVVIIKRVRQAWFFDVVFWLWPIWRMKRFNTSGTTLIIHANDVFTKGTADLARVELHINSVITLRVLTVRYILNAFGIPKVDDLTKKCRIQDETGVVDYEDTRLMGFMRRKVQDNARDSVRRAAASFVWDSNHESSLQGQLEIVRDRHKFELATLFELAARESLLGQSNLLVRPVGLEHITTEEFLEKVQQGQVLPDLQKFFGKGVISIDINIPDLDLAPEIEGASEAQKAVNRQFVAKQEAAGAKSMGFAQAEIITRQGEAKANAAEAMLKKLPEVDQNTVLAGQILEGKNTTMIPVGTSLTDILKTVIGGK